MTLTVTAWCWLGLAAGVLGSALFSGLETGIYSVNRVRLHVLAHHRRGGAAKLEAMLRRPNRVLATLLVWNNVSNYVLSLSLTALLDDAGYRGWGQVVVTSVLLMPILLIFGEIVPKDVFRANADWLCTRFAGMLGVLQGVFTVIPVVPLMDRIGRAFGTGRDAMRVQTVHPRRRVNAMIREGVGTGLLSHYQSEMVGRVLGMERLTVRDVMVAWSRVVSVRAEATVESVWKLADRVTHRYLPVVDGEGKPVGVLDVDGVLAANGEGESRGLVGFTTGVVELDAGTSCRAALLRMQKERCPLAMVSQAGRFVGLVSTKELVEPLVGELEVW